MKDDGLKNCLDYRFYPGAICFIKLEFITVIIFNNYSKALEFDA